ncbi:MAG: hypothetical protein AAF413_02405 [Patescibacteria group bacterium]
MRVTRPITQAELIQTWLLAELGSSRFSSELKSAVKKHGHKLSLVTKPNLKNYDENKARARVLREYRGQFWDALQNREWNLVELDQADVRELIYTDWQHWKKLSGYTRLVGRAADNIKDGLVDDRAPMDSFFELAKQIEQGTELNPIVLIDHVLDGKQIALEVIEGHLRSTAYAMADKPSTPLMAYIGSTQ